MYQVVQLNQNFDSSIDKMLAIDKVLAKSL